MAISLLIDARSRGHRELQQSLQKPRRIVAAMAAEL